MLFRSELEIIKISFSYDGFLTIEEKDLNTIFLGLRPNLINYQLQIINNLKNEFKKNSFSKKRCMNGQNYKKFFHARKSC